jgi:dienelactone hydrolase
MYRGKMLLNRPYWETFLIITALLCGLCTLTWADSSAEHQKRLEAHYGLERPEGSGPFPAIMMVPGCYGFADPLNKDHYLKTTKELKDQGFAVVKVDIFSARGRKNCGEVIPEEVTEDILTAARYLRTLPFIKATAINVIGWSFGGDIALAALSKGESSSHAPVDAVVAYRPWVDVASPWRVDVPVLVLCGAKDTFGPPSKVESLLSKVPARQSVKYFVYPDAYHYFYNSSLPAQMSLLLGTVGYNEKAAKAAWGEVERFLRR